MSLLLWLPLNSSSLNNKGILPVTFSSSSLSYGDGGKIASQCKTAGAVSATGNFDSSNSNGFSASIWWKIEEGNSFSLKVPANNGTTNGEILFLKMDYTTNYAIKWHFTSNAPQLIWIYDKRSGSGVWELNKWHHFCWTVENSSPTRVKVYVDGEQVANTTTSYQFSLIPGAAKVEGTAKANDFRVYNHCLSPREVKELSKGLMLHYNFEDTYLEGTTNLLPSSLQNANITSGGASYNISVSSGTAFTLSGYVTLYPDDVCTNPRMTIVVQFTDGTEKSASVSNQIKDGVERYAEVTYTVPSGKTPKAIRGWILDYSTAGVRHAKLRRMQIEAKDHATPYTSSTRTGEKCYDCSGRGMHGTLTGSVKVCNEGLNGTKSIYLDGSSSGPYIITPNINLSDTMTYMVNAKIATAKNQFLIDHRVSNGGYQPFYVYSDGRVQIWGSGSSAGGTGTTIPSDGKYHQLAVVINAGTAYMYVDGVQKWSTALSAVSANNPITLGARHSKDTGTRFNGYLNDFKVYATALSASEIKKMYDTPIVINKNGTIITRGSIVE